MLIALENLGPLAPTIGFHLLIFYVNNIVLIAHVLKDLSKVGASDPGSEAQPHF